ncbi:hypothetical protein [Embleya sp. NBC_00896]|uniref:uridine kinase family protein n=1 Tax=Embleya sp. NBC_00896 TaxID=2975961 RepID=UPI002F90AA84|nr:hypothetical protein OG928_37985 [Embleya sp. NBC_00896]
MSTERPKPRWDATAARLAGRVAVLPPSLGHTRLITVDGVGGSGKTTFADALAAHLGAAPVVRLDDFARPGDFFGWLSRLQGQLLDPLALRQAARCDTYDWGGYRVDGYVEVPAAPVVVLEGVGAGRAELGAVSALRIWVDTPLDVATARTLDRDGPGIAWFWRLWRAAESAHLARDRPWSRADVTVDGVTGEPTRTRSARSPSSASTPAG